MGIRARVKSVAHLIMRPCTAAVAASGLGLSAVTLYSSSGSGADCDGELTHHCPRPAMAGVL
eukprot:10842-Eustigmatos_ZCMA.PRE.1